MGVKEDVVKETLDPAEISSLASQFAGIALPLREHGVLFGGYSGTSIRVTAADGTKAVLKVCNGYTLKDATEQAAVAGYAFTDGFTGLCAPLPLIDQDSPTPFVVARADGTPVMMLRWVDGTAADKVVGKGDVPSASVMAAIGAGLAGMHSVRVSPLAAASLRAIEAGGACDLRKHLSGELEALMLGSAAIQGHDFLPFYARQLASLRAAMAEPGLPRGLLHGDPFLDNVLVSGADGSLCGFVDLEDVCVGPLLFDVACCASACCFREDGALDARRLRPLLSAYAQGRPLEPAERRRFVAFMKLAMLCNCTWRFINVRRPARAAQPAPPTRCARHTCPARSLAVQHPPS